MLARDGVSPGSRSRDGGTGLVLTWESAEWKSQSNGGNGIGRKGFGLLVLRLLVLLVPFGG